jgi:hypothetical protein
MFNLHTEGAWDAIRKLITKRSHRCQVAVAYFGAGASELLPLRAGSTLIVDLSPRAVRSGQTKPSELGKLARLGVDVYSVENLHAKVFVVGGTAIVGSTNVSTSSATRLIEAALQTSEQRVVSACRNFVLSLRGETVTPQHLKRLQKLYRPPKFGTGGNLSGKRHKPVPHHAPLWIVPLRIVDLDDEDRQAEERSIVKAKSQLQSRRFRVESFMWSGAGFINRLKEGKDLILQIVHEGRGRFMVSEPGRLLRVERYRKGRGTHANVAVELPLKSRRIGARRLIRKLGPRSKSLTKKVSPKKLADPVLVHDLMNLWVPTKGLL